jgi:hypothetical protein
VDRAGAVGARGLRWLSAQPDLAVREARPACDRALGHVDPWTLGSVVIWLSRLQVPASLPAGLPSGVPEPFAREMAGDWHGAAAEWDRLGRSYDAALARLGSSDEGGLRQALTTLDELGARAAAAVARRRMKELGVKAIPRPSQVPGRRAAGSGPGWRAARSGQGRWAAWPGSGRRAELGTDSQRQPRHPPGQT